MGNVTANVNGALASSKSSGAALAIARSFALPSTENATRIKTEFTTSPTAATSTHYYLNHDFTKPTPAVGFVQNLPDGSGMYAMCRDPFHTLWYSTYAVQDYYYEWWTYHALPTHGFPAGPNVRFDVFTSTFNGPSQPLLLDYATAQGNKLIESARMYSFMDHGLTYVWLEPGMSIELTNATGINFTGAVFTTYNWTPVGPEEYSTAALSAAILQPVTPILGGFGAIQPGFYSFRVGGTPPGIVGSSPHFGLRTKVNINYCVKVYEHLPFLDTYVNAISSIRINGLSMMLTCKAAPLYVNGVMTGVNLPNGSTIQAAFNLGQSPTTTLAQYSGAVEFKEKQGMYSFAPVSTMATLEMHQLSAKANSALYPPNRQGPAPYGGFVAIAFNSGETSAGVFASNSFILTLLSEIEFLTPNQWFNLEPPLCTSMEVQAAMEVLSTLQQFHENPLHWSEIKAALRRAGSYAWRVAPALLLALGLPAHAAMVNAVQTFVGR